MNKGGWLRLIRLREIRKATHFEGLKVTSHVLAHLEIFTRSELRQVAADTGSFTIIKRLVSSANKRIFESISVTMSFMYSRNSKRPKS